MMTRRKKVVASVLGIIGWALVLLGADCNAGPKDCFGITAAGPVDVELIEVYDSGSQFRGAESRTPPIAQAATSCGDIDGLGVGAQFALEAEDAVFGDNYGGCYTYEARVLQGPVISGHPVLPVDDSDFVNDTLLYQTMLVEEGEIEAMGCTGRWLLLVQPKQELFSDPVSGELPPHVVVRVMTFDAPCSAGTLPADTERCADVWAASLDPL